MRVLYLTFYFEPDLSAGSFRNTALAAELARQLAPNGGQVHVITTQPNRYPSFSPPAPAHEQRGNLTIDRVPVSTHQNGYFDQMHSFWGYARTVRKLAKQQQYDLVFVSSSRLFSALLGAWLSSRLGIPLVLDVRDLFREVMLDMLNTPVRMLLAPILWIIETYTFGRARHINMVSEGFRDYFSRFGQASYSYFTNGIDAEFLNMPSSIPPASNQTKTIFYAGNIGAGQDLHTLIPEAARLLGSTYRFIVIGDGGTLPKLEIAVQLMGVNNVEIYSPVSRQTVLNFYQQADYLLVHLADVRALKRVLPSKLFEYGATDKPILAGVSGYPAQFVQKHLDNAILFNPGDAHSLTAQLRETPYRLQNRPEFRRQFNRQAIVEDMAKCIRLVVEPELVNVV
ncbi:MAG: glycosyltransferase family 4 protein [Spirosoma sp.]|nr:glycosyltransferase family 4 protein [Spirosoma sp.]